MKLEIGSILLVTILCLVGLVCAMLQLPWWLSFLIGGVVGWMYAELKAHKKMTYDMTYDTFLEHLAATPRDWYVHNFGVYSAIRTMSNDQCPLMVVCGGLVSTTIYKSVIRDVNSYIVRAADEGPHRLQALDDDTLTLSIRADLLKACGLTEKTENND